MIKWQVLNIFSPGGEACLHHHAAVRHTVRTGKGVDWSFPFRWVVSPTFRVLLPLSLPMMSLLSIHLENPIVKYLFNAYKSSKQFNIFILAFFRRLNAANRVVQAWFTAWLLFVTTKVRNFKLALIWKQENRRPLLLSSALKPFKGIRY